jgi:hypothetical protein
MSSLEIDKADPFTNYNYAFYFTVTTIMTVGYGDITPKNRLEVLVVSFIEIFGTSSTIKASSCLGLC